MIYILNFYTKNTRVPTGPTRFKKGRVATKKYARKYGWTFKYLSPHVEFLDITRSTTRPSPPINSSNIDLCPWCIV